MYPCTFEIGEQVRLFIPDENIDTKDAYIRTITFTNLKVRFAIFLIKSETTLHNVDSAFVEKIGSAKWINFEDDNYS